MKEGSVRNFFCLIWIKEPCVQKFEELARLKILGISQTKNVVNMILEYMIGT